jgi:hypothetical protein
MNSFVRRNCRCQSCQAPICIHEDASAASLSHRRHVVLIAVLSCASYTTGNTSALASRVNLLEGPAKRMES